MVAAGYVLIVFLLVMLVLFTLLLIHSVKMWKKPKPTSVKSYTSRYRTGDGEKAWEWDQMMKKAHENGMK